MERVAYQKVVPKFFQELLSKLNKINLYSTPVDDASKEIFYQPTKDGINLYTNLTIKLSHELAHIIEVKDNNRLLQPDYGIKNYYPKTKNGQLKAIAREARVRGIQTRLVELAFNHFVMLYHRGANQYNLAGGPIGKFSNTQEVSDWSRNITSSAYHYWTEEKVRHTWEQKSEFINHWLETKHPSDKDYADQMTRNN